MDYKKFWDSQELYSSLSDEQQEELINLVDFEVIKKSNTCYKVRDIQGGNLGNIEQEEFDSLESILVRIEHYLDEYFDDEELIEC